MTLDIITDAQRKKWIRYAQKHTAIEFSMYLKYVYREMLISEGNSVLNFWKQAQINKGGVV